MHDLQERWDEIERHLRALAHLMLPADRTYPDIAEYLDAGEYGCALWDLAHEVDALRGKTPEINSD
jgi:hypothetical protein